MAAPHCYFQITFAPLSFKIHSSFVVLAIKYYHVLSHLIIFFLALFIRHFPKSLSSCPLLVLPPFWQCQQLSSMWIFIQHFWLYRSFMPSILVIVFFYCSFFFFSKKCNLWWTTLETSQMLIIKETDKFWYFCTVGHSL